MLIALVAAVLLAVVLVQTPAVQTRITKHVSEKYLSAFDADITFDKISLRPFNTLTIKNICVRDREPQAKCDTLFSAEWVVASFNLRGLMEMRDGKGLHIHSVTVRNGLFNLVIEGRQKNNLKRMFRLKKKETPPERNKDIFSIDKIRLKNLSYGMQNVIPAGKVVKAGSIDWKDVLVSEIELKGEHLRFSKGVMTGELGHLSFREKSGFRCHNMSGSAAVGNGKTVVRDIRISDDWSDVEIPLFTMSYDNSKAFLDFINKVSLGGEFNGSTISTRTLKYFVPAFADSDATAEIHGSLDGPVSALKFRNLRVILDGGNIDASVSGSVTGLPDIRKTHFTLTLSRCRTSVKGLDKTIRGITGNDKFNLGKTGLSTYAVLKGRAKGSLNRMEAYADLDSGIGGLVAEISATDLINKGKAAIIEGTLHADDLDLGKISGKKILGKFSARTAVGVTLDRNSGPSLRIDSLMVDKLCVNNYEYHHIAAAGKISEELFDGRIISQDPAFNFIFQGIFSLAPKTRNSAYQFYANIGHADLHAMNFDKREPSNLSLRVNANFNRTPEGTMLGNISIGDVRLESEGQRYDVGDINIASHSVNNRYRINFDSGFARARYDGTKSVTEFASALSALTLKRELPALFTEPADKWQGGTYDLDFKCIDPSAITGFLKPGLYIDKNTEMGLHISDDGMAEAWMKSRRIAFKEQYIKGIDLHLDNRNDILSGKLDCEEISAASISLENNSLTLYANDNMTGLGLSFENDGQLLTKGEFVARGDLQREDNGDVCVSVSILPSGFYFNSVEWNIMPATIDFCGGNLKVDGMELASGDQNVRVDGGISREHGDTLKIGLERFDIGFLNPFISKGGLGIKGAVTGEAMLTSEADAKKGVIADFLIDSASVAGTELGSVYAKSLWNKDFNRFDISLSNEIDNRTSIKADADFYPSSKNLEALVDLNRQDITCLSSLLTGVFSEVKGDISGRIRAEGPLDRMEISSEGTRFNNTLLTVDYTMVPYRVDGPFSIDSEGIHFDNVAVRDLQRGKGVIYGKVGWDRFKDMALDIHINLENMEAINRPFKDNDGYYGRIFGTGRVDIEGPVKDISIGVDMSTEGNSRLYIPLSNTATAGTTDILKFKEPVKEVQSDPYEEMMARLRNTEAVRRRNSLGVNINAHVNRLAEAMLEINKDNGSAVAGRGNGDIIVDFKTGRPLSLKGDYTLDEGNLHLNLMNLATRDFDINEGSSVKFNGGIMDTDLDIDAIYTTKASISSLIGDTTSVNSRRNVNCSLKVSGKLREPRINFGIDIPDLEPSVKSRVENALSTEDKVQRQLFALLLTNSFMQDDQGGVNNNNAASTALYSNAMNLISNQLNNILTKLGIPLDLGLKYQQNNKGNDVFDVAVSTQLFNNRVIINGNIGNRQYKNGNNNSEVAGDVDIEIKLDRSGSLRLNLFTHSADQYSNYLDNSQRSGLGIAYQREFNKVSEVFKYMFAGKARREQLDLEEQRRLEEEGMKTIVIE